MSYDGPERRSMNDTKEIFSRLNAIDINLGVANTKLDNMHKEKNATYQQIHEMLEKHNDTLYGNGKPGLTHHVTRIEELGKHIDEHITFDKWFYGLMVTTQIGILIKLFT